MVCLKKYLLGLGYIYLPMIISSNVLGKTNSRMIQNNKFKDIIIMRYLVKNKNTIIF